MGRRRAVAAGADADRVAGIHRDLPGGAAPHRAVAPRHRWRGARGAAAGIREMGHRRSEEHTSELQSLMRISYAVFCLKKKKNKNNLRQSDHIEYEDHGVI